MKRCNREMIAANVPSARPAGPREVPQIKIAAHADPRPIEEPRSRASRLADLLARAGLGDRQAFADLYAAAAPKLFAVSLRIVRERALAEEVLQDGFVSIWNHAAGYAREKSAPSAWMAAIVRNRSLDVVRRPPGPRAIPSSWR